MAPLLDCKHLLHRLAEFFGNSPPRSGNGAAPEHILNAGCRKAFGPLESDQRAIPLPQFRLDVFAMHYTAPRPQWGMMHLP